VTIQAQILEELEELKDVFDTSILLITHDLAVVAETCDRVNVMYAGEIVERAETRELFDDPQHPYTQGLIASTPQIDDPDRDLQPIEDRHPVRLSLRATVSGGRTRLLRSRPAVPLGGGERRPRGRVSPSRGG
jgi:ABC-type dipeptide/oligopeptide/nickel transport system ATPase component